MDKNLFDTVAFEMFSTRKNLCALEVIPDEGKAELFFREDPDTLRREKIPFSPFLLLEKESLAQECFLPGSFTLKKLEGAGKYAFQAFFGTFSAYEHALKTLKQRTGFSPGGMGGPYKVFSDLVQQALITERLRLFSGMTFPEVKRMQFDIETLCSPAYDFPNASRAEDEVVIITLSDSTGFEKVLSSGAGGEKALLEEFVRTVCQRDPDILEGHNICRFDLPYLEERAKRHKVRLALGRDGSLLKHRASRFSVAERQIAYTRYDIYGRHVADTLHLLAFYDAVNRNLDSFNLKYAAKHFGIASPDRTYIQGEKITEAWHNDREELLKYALDDVRETGGISSILSPSYFYQAQLIPLSYQNCIVRGNATRIDGFLAAEYLVQGHALPAPERGRAFAGALTSAEKTGVFENVDHCDVRSLYPSVILAKDLCPLRDTLRVFPRELSRLREFRLKAKDAARKAETKAEKDHFGALQKTFKILINSFYGYLGFEQGFLNDFAMAEAVTSTGRKILSRMQEILEEAGASIIEMDTDGIYFVRGAATLAEIDSRLREGLPPGIEVDFDESYKAMFCYKSKNYALLTSSGEVSISGAALKSRGLEPFQRNYMEEIVRCLLEKHPEKGEKIHQEYCRKIADHKISFRELSKSETLSDSPEAYKRKLAEGSARRSAAYELALASGKDFRQGDQISFYVTGTKKKVSVVENSKLLSDAKEEIRDENTAYYLDKLEELRRKFAPFLPEGKSIPPCGEKESGKEDALPLFS
ncbi:MAG: DNA polymerase II [Lentisphaeria bacterium]|nr:DNA polymerase II [Lentisphaeria bacterium]